MGEPPPTLIFSITFTPTAIGLIPLTIFRCLSSVQWGVSMRRSPLKETVFQSRLSPHCPAFSKDHRLYQQTILPGSAFIEMALAAGAKVFNTPVALKAFVIQQPLILPTAGRTVQLILTQESASASAQIFSLSEEGEESWTLHSAGKIVECPSTSAQIDLARLQNRLTPAAGVMCRSGVTPCRW